jgi:hypothetical protein
MGPACHGLGTPAPPTGWNPLFDALIQQFGNQAVWDAAWRETKFPPQWIQETVTVRRVAATLIREDQTR